MKIFISQPMNGKTNEEIEQERTHAVEAAKEQLGSNIEVIDSFFKDAPHDVRPGWCLGKSIQLLTQADLCVFIGDWKKYRGCKIEHEVAEAYGVPVMEV